MKFTECQHKEFVWVANLNFDQFEDENKTLLDGFEYPEDLKATMEAGIRGIGGTDANMQLLED